MRRKNITKLVVPKVSPKNQNKKSKNKPAQTIHANKESDSYDESDSDSDSSVYSGLGEEETTSSDDTSLDIDSDVEEQHVDGALNRTSKSTDEVGTATLKPDEYEHDSSDEEDIKNTVGDIPMRWYDDYDHLGYDWDGKKILKPSKIDELDNFINKMEDPNYWRTVHDPLTGQNVVLSDEDVLAVKRIQAGLYPDPNYNPYEPWIDFFSHETMIHPLFNRPDSKQSFIPSLIEKRQVSKMLYAIKMGWSKPRVEQPEEDKYYLLWDQDEQVQISQRLQHYLPAPKLKLPGHEESYNPPPEYLFTSEEEEKWKNDDPEDRKLNFIPRRYSSLREVPYYSNFIKERFERCLDLYLCPRQRKMKLNVDPEDLIPKLPKPKDLQPFPTTLAMVYRGHKNMVRCITVEYSGQYLSSASDDCTIKIWEIQTGRCLKTIPTEAPVTSIAWCPNPNVCLVAATVNRNVIILNPQVGNCNTVSDTDVIFNIPLEAEAETSKKVIEWKIATEEEYEKGYRMLIEHSKDVSQVVWHAKGDYFASLMPSGGKASVHIHQLSKRRSQQPFSKSKGLVQCVLFHPSRPYFFVATQRYIRIYNLVKQELTKKLLTNCKWVSSIAVHPGGDNVICGSYDSRLSWFDLDLSSKPYQTLRHQKKALRKVSFHPRYPLFASASDDCSVVICHGMVYSDLLQNPLIVPVKVLHGHTSKNDVGVMDCQFHPTQPWIFTSGADGNVFLYT